TEADLVAARVAPAVEGGIPPYGAARRMAAALERVAVLNRVPIGSPSWRHFTIEKRIDILLHAEDIDPFLDRKMSPGRRPDGNAISFCTRRPTRRSARAMNVSATGCGWARRGWHWWHSCARASCSV